MAAARVRPADPGFPGLTPPAPPAGTGNWDDATADATPDQRAAVVREFVDAAEGLETAGYVESMRVESVYANTAGQSVAGRVTGAAADGIARVPGADGVARQGSTRLGELGGADLGRIAAAKARAGAEPVDLPPGDYEVVLEPACVADILAVPARVRVQRPAGGRGAVVRAGRRAAVRPRAADLGRPAGRAVHRAAVRRRGHAAAAARPGRRRRERGDRCTTGGPRPRPARPRPGTRSRAASGGARCRTSPGSAPAPAGRPPTSPPGCGGGCWSATSGTPGSSTRARWCHRADPQRGLADRGRRDRPRR